MTPSTVGLPGSSRLDIGTFSRIFSDTTNSYKHFFFLALLDRIGTRSLSALDRPIPLADLAVDMVLSAWYPHGFCRLSLGARDMLQVEVDKVDWGGIRGAWIKAGGPEWRRLRESCAASLDPDTLMRYVPFRLLRPFFKDELSGVAEHLVNERVVALSEEFFMSRKPLYCFTHDRAGIILHHEWAEYLDRNAPILRGWARFNLAAYLQSRNPNATGIMEKLEAPLARASLDKQTFWWREALPLIGGRARCIYTGAALDPEDISLDHYLPWSFVAHDRLWNLVPVDRAVNSAKSDRLPDRRYLDGLVDIQHAGIVALFEHWPLERWTNSIEPWIVDFGIDKAGLLDRTRLRSAYESMILSLEHVASRQGFPLGWTASA